MRHSITSRLLTILSGTLALALTGCNDPALDPLPATHSEVHFQGGAAPPVDVLWVVDDSGSMSQEQSKLAANFQSFIQYFTALDLDFQLAVTTTDTNAVSGNFAGNPTILTPDTPNLADKFIQNVTVGTDGSGTERGLQGAQMALSEPLLSGANAGFLREDAILAVIIVSDEEDQSELDVDQYVDFFLGLKAGNPARVNLSVIVGDLPNGCGSNDANADPGERYHEAANALNGVKASICAEDFGPVLDQIGSVVAGLATAFPLDYTPAPDTIEVKVDGVVVPKDPLTGWTWNTQIGGVVFSPAAIPAECAVIEISYKVENYGGPITNGNNESPPEQCGTVSLPAGDSLEGGAFACTFTPTSTAPGVPALASLLVLSAVLIHRRRRQTIAR